MNLWAFLIVAVLIWTLLHFVTWKAIKAWWTSELAKLHGKQAAAIEQNQDILRKTQAVLTAQQNGANSIQKDAGAINNDRKV